MDSEIATTRQDDEYCQWGDCNDEASISAYGVGLCDMHWKIAGDLRDASQATSTYIFVKSAVRCPSRLVTDHAPLDRLPLI